MISTAWIGATVAGDSVMAVTVSSWLVKSDAAAVAWPLGSVGDKMDGSWFVESWAASVANLSAQSRQTS
jgi:hypothetical protein